MGGPDGGGGSGRAAALLLLASLGLSLAALEVGARLGWRLSADVASPGRLLEVVYPELAGAEGGVPEPWSRILLLGGSVLDDAWGEVEPEILEQLFRSGRRFVVSVNLARPAHTTRDSLLKYRALADSDYDAVIVYHGINDVRVNAVPPELYRDDYGHLAWYETAHALAPAQGQARFALPATLRFLWARGRQLLRPDAYAPMDRPREDWLEYGARPRSPAAFETHLRELLELARERGQPVILATFALHVPDDYSLAAFRRRRLDYLLHHSPLELWGRPDDVQRTVAAHNEVVRRLAAEDANAELVDQARSMPRGRRWFNDPCHLTTEGSAVFAEALVEALEPHLAPAR